MSYLQLVAAMSFYAVYYLATRAFQSAFLDRVGFAETPWLWAIPSTWFAALIAVAGGRRAARGVDRVGRGAAAVGHLRAARRRTPVARLRAARRRGDRGRRSRRAGAACARLPGFGSGEAPRRRAPGPRAVPLRSAVPHGRARHPAADRFLPAAWGRTRAALQDPFTGAAEPSGPGVFFAIVFIPITLHAALTVERELARGVDLLRHAGLARAHRRRREELRLVLFSRQLPARAGGGLELLLRTRLARRGPRALRRAARAPAAAARR